MRNKISWGPYPICTGYQSVGIVEYAGGKTKGFKAGDKVYLRMNFGKMQMADGTAITPASGTHAAHVVVGMHETHGAALMPSGVPDDVASMFVMPAVGFYGTDMAAPGLGDVVVVYGSGLIGLGVIAACSLRGCVVIAVDIDDKRLALAKELGADYAINSKTHDVEAEVKKIAPNLADVVFESTGIPALLDPAIALCRELGKFVWQGNYGAAPISMHFLTPHVKRLQMFFPCDDGHVACRRAVLKNIAMGAIHWEKTITHRVKSEDAPEFFERINRDQAPDVIGAVIRWSEK